MRGTRNVRSESEGKEGRRKGENGRSRDIKGVKLLEKGGKRGIWRNVGEKKKGRMVKRKD